MMPSSSLTFYMTKKQYTEMKLIKFRKCWDRDNEVAPRKK